MSRYKPVDLERNAQAYKNSQIQRRLERNIRNAKREGQLAEAAKNYPAAQTAKESVKRAQAEMRGFIRQTGRTRRPSRELIHT